MSEHPMLIDDQIRRYIPVVWGVVHRMNRRGEVVPTVDLEDLAAVGIWGVWDAIRSWEGDAEPPLAYVGAYVWRYARHYQRDCTKAEGWNRHKNQRVAVVTSYDATDDVGRSLLDQLAGPHDVFEHAYWSVRLSEAERRCRMMRDPYHTLAHALLDDQPVMPLAKRLGYPDDGTARAVIERVRDILAGNDDLPDDWRNPGWQLVGIDLLAAA